MRVHLNRVVAPPAVAAALLAIGVAERARPGAGRRVAGTAIRLVGRLCGVRFEVRGADRLDPGGHYVFVPNHGSPLDIPALLVGAPELRFVAAAELFGIGLLAPAMRALGTFPITRGKVSEARRQLRDVVAARPPRLVVFAQGGIAPAGELRFRSGAFSVAIETGAAVVPVAIEGTDHVMPPGRPLRVRPGTVRVTFLDPIPTAGMEARQRWALRDEAQAAVAAQLGRAA